MNIDRIALNAAQKITSIDNQNSCHAAQRKAQIQTAVRDAINEAMKAEPKYIKHKVMCRDTLSHIAELCGCTVDEIVWLNEIQNPDLIYIGQKLVVPFYEIGE